MKVIHKTPDKLILQSSPWFRWMLVSVFNLCGIICLLVLLAATWDTFECHRNLAVPTQGQCTLTHQSWFTKNQRSWQLEQIQGVNLVPDGFHKNGRLRYRIILQTTTGEVLLGLSPNNSDSPPLAQEIRQFLDEAQLSSVQNQNDDRPYNFFCFIVCLSCAGLLNIWGKRVTLTISKYNQQLTLQRRNLLGTQTIVYPIDQIATVIVQKEPGGKFGPMGRLAIGLKDGKTIVAHDYDRFSTEASSRKSETLIYDFLGLQTGCDRKLP